MCYCEEGPTVTWQSTPIARIEHKCCECGSVISKGEKYHLDKGVWEGDFRTFKTCEICEKVRSAALSGDYDCICYEQLWETVGVDYEEVGIVHP